jgi:hypothetical protein|tara:strand:- start:441 stop:644 length:204 start_codon:yes stop_codon:yes gene_type:complete
MVFLSKRKSIDTKNPHATGHRDPKESLKSKVTAFDLLKIIVLLPFLILIYLASIIVIHVVKKNKVSY